MPSTYNVGMTDHEHENQPDIPPLLADAREPESDDPRKWTPPEVVGLALMYAYGIEVLTHLHHPQWREMRYLAEDLLFNRDLLQDWIDLHGPDALEYLIETELPDLPLVEESDERLQELYVEAGDVRQFLDTEYKQFRDDVDPPREHRWWWLDAELYGRQIH